MRRTYSREFRVQVCTDIRTGVMGWRESARHYELDVTTIGHWLKRYGIEERTMTDNEKKLITEYEAKISALERKVGQLTMEVELLKKTRRQSLASNSAPLSLVSGPKVSPSDGGAK
ncbi:MAG: transposase [Nitrospiraceae bacterium]|nr:transposase [Nitrospiraceae bacterium]